MEEQWVPVSGWHGLYEVSDRGRIRSLDRRVPYKGGPRTRIQRGRVLKLDKSEVAKFRDTERREDKRVCRVVLEAFVGPPATPDTVAVHANGDERDNRIENLSWGTHQDATYAKAARGNVLRLNEHPSAKLNLAIARQIRHGNEPVSVIAKRFGIAKSLVQSIRAGSVWREDKDLVEYKSRARKRVFSKGAA